MSLYSSAPALSVAIDNEAHHLLLSAFSICFHALALSSGLPNACWGLGSLLFVLGLHLQEQEFCCCLQYWLKVLFHSHHYTTAWTAVVLLTFVEIIREVVAAMETPLLNAMPSEI